jgi:phenylalanyl-tRNA synthetase alpha chain
VIDQLVEVRDRALRDIAGAGSEEDLERLRVEHLGRRAPLNEVLSGLASVPPDQRRALGQAGNEAKQAIQAALEARAGELRNARLADLAEAEAIDVTFPPPPLGRGHIHPLTRVQREVETVLEGLGYQVELGPEVETEWYNFEALNIPAGHPARESWDSFYITDDLLLRAHTSPVQIRAMERLQAPPIYVIVPGRAYRRDALDASHSPYFMQVEGLAVDRGLTVGDLKGTLIYMMQSLFGPDRRIRMRPSHFPFTEPSFEFDTSCGICGGQGCRTCSGKGWLETGGCGMVHPQVLRNGGIDPEQWTGYAWGFGIERMAMLKYDITDIRLFYENDLRFLEQLG